MSEFIEVKANARSMSLRKPVYGVGVNDSDYITDRRLNGKRNFCPYYARWRHMIERCYSEKYQETRPTYKGCTVCGEWLVFSVFKAWMVKQDWKDKELDKDILTQGNNVYSPENCLFVTTAINNLLKTSMAIRGSLPIGVTYEKENNKYQSQISIKGKMKTIGRFDTPKLAHEAYKVAKYAHIKEIALQQEEPLRSALLKYKI